VAWSGAVEWPCTIFERVHWCVSADNDEVPGPGLLLCPLSLLSPSPSPSPASPLPPSRQCVLVWPVPADPCAGARALSCPRRWRFLRARRMSTRSRATKSFASTGALLSCVPARALPAASPPAAAHQERGSRCVSLVGLVYFLHVMIFHICEQARAEAGAVLAGYLRH